VILAKEYQRMVHFSERRTARRFEIDCGVMVRLHGRGRCALPVTGRLRDIAVGGALLHLGSPLTAGSRVVVHVRFPNPASTAGTVVRFEGVIVRVGERGHTAVVFRRGGKFLREGLGLACAPQTRRVS
jgi:hypothetical protein